MAVRKENVLLINVPRLPEAGLEFAHEFPREWLENIPEFSDDSGPHLEGPIRVAGKVRFEGTHLQFEGRVEARLHTFCSRCGRPLESPIDSRFELRLIPDGPGDDEEGEEFSPEETDRSFFQGEEVDLTPYFQEEIALQVPDQILCAEDCKGLCPICGKDLNEADCDCQPKALDPRLETLRKLKIEK